MVSVTGGVTLTVVLFCVVEISKAVVLFYGVYFHFIRFYIYLYLSILVNNLTS